VLFCRPARRQSTESDLEFQDGCQSKANVQRIGTRHGKFGGQFIFERREWKQLFCCLLRERERAAAECIICHFEFANGEAIYLVSVCARESVHHHTVHNILLVVRAALQK
jgi:hypothetical protein